MSTEPRTRIVINGCSGSGKSTLARRLSAVTGLPLVELDSLFHQANWVPMPEDEFRLQVTNTLDISEREHGGWIADGNYDSTLQGLVRARAEIVIWFDLPKHTVMWRILRRTLRRAALQEELWNGNRERWTNLLRWAPEQSIIRWAWTRHHVYRDRLRLEAAAHAPEQQWIRVASQRDVERVLSGFSC